MSPSDTRRGSKAEPASPSAESHVHGIEPDAWVASGVPAEPVLSIVVLVLNRLDNLIRCLDAVARHTPPAHEVIVLGNGTDPAVLEPLREREGVIVLRSSVNLGYGRGCNRAARVARGSHLVFLNDDAEVEAGWAEALIDTAATVPSAGAVGARVLASDGTLLEAGMVLWRDGTTTPVGRGLAPGTAAHRERRDVDYCSGCCLLILRPLWERLGGFDPDFFPAYCEDADLAMRLRRSGYRVLFEPRARVRHLGGVSSAPGWRDFMAARNARLLVSRWTSELAQHGLCPGGADVQAAVDREIERAERSAPAAGAAPARSRSVTAPEPGSGAALARSTDPSHAADRRMEIMRDELAAARDMLLVKDEYIAQLSNDRLALQRIHRMMTRLPIPRSAMRRAGRWLRRG